MYKQLMLLVLSTQLVRAMESQDLMQMAETQERQKEIYRQQFHAATDVYFDKICDRKIHQLQALQQLTDDIEYLTLKVMPALIEPRRSHTDPITISEAPPSNQSPVTRQKKSNHLAMSSYLIDSHEDN